MMTLATTTVGLCLEPLDVLFFRDGRPFTGSERSVSGLPLPQTLAGAIRTALLQQVGCDFSRMKGATTFVEAVARACAKEHHWIGQVAIRGPWLAQRQREGDSFEVFVPVPAILQEEKQRKSGMLYRLAPLLANQLPGWNPPADQQDLRPVWLKHLSPTEPAAGYLTTQGLASFLRGEPVTTADLVPPDNLFALDYRTGIGISPDRLTAKESHIFGRGFLALKKNVFLYAEVELPNGAGNGSLFDDIRTLSLGGEGRHATLQRFPKLSWPQEIPKGKQKPLVMLTTPCAFQAGWKPQCLNGQLTAAVVPGSQAFSGWDLARGGPKTTRFAVPAGSVYFLNSLPKDWPETLAENDEEHQQGWGCYLRGVWTDE